MTLIKPCCDSGIHLLPKLIEENRELTLTFCPWCAKKITNKPPIEINVRISDERGSPEPPRNCFIEALFHLSQETTVRFTFDHACLTEQEAEAVALPLRNFLKRLNFGGE